MKLTCCKVRHWTTRLALMGKPTDIKSFKKAHRTTYNRIYAEGYQDAYRELKSNGQIQLYRIEFATELRRARR